MNRSVWKDLNFIIFSSIFLLSNCFCFCDDGDHDHDDGDLDHDHDDDYLCNVSSSSSPSSCNVHDVYFYHAYNAF